MSAATPGQADPWQVIADVMSELLRGGQTAGIRCRAALGVLASAGIDFDGDPVAIAIAAQEPKPAPLSALGVRSGELTVDEVQELRGKLEASLAQSARQPKLAPDLGTAWRLLDEARASLRELSGRVKALAGEWVADAEHDETRVRPTVISDARARTLRECADELRKRTAEVTDGTHA